MIKEIVDYRLCKKIVDKSLLIRHREQMLYKHHQNFTEAALRRCSYKKVF